MLGSRDEGESTGRPGRWEAEAEEAVVTTVVSKAVVEVCAVGEAPKEILSSKLLTEAGGLLAASSDFRTERLEDKEVDNLLSTVDLDEGGGILMLERSAEALVVSA